MKLILLVFVFLALNVHLSNESIIGVDLGSEFFKVVLVKVNEPFQIVENIQSKRKTEAAIAFRDDERWYGADAVTRRARNPSQTFHNLHEFLGKTLNDESLKAYLDNYFITYDLAEDAERNSYSFKVKYLRKDYTFSVEDVYGMFFRYIQFLSTKYAKSPIKECVVSVPVFFGYKERFAIAQAINMTGLKLLTIVNGNLGAALNYALEKKTAKTENIIFYNMGSSFTQTTLVQFISEEAVGQNNRTILNTKMKVLAEGWDKNLGGRNFDYNFVKHLMQKFDESPQRQGKPSVVRNPKIAEKILSEAIRAKEILSANKEVNVQVLGLEDNVNLQERVTRETFEKINSDEISRTYNTIADVLQYTNMTIDDIDQVELLGGGIRVPAVLSQLKERVGENKLGQHLNGDESMAFGTAFIAANYSSSGIRTKPLPAQYGPSYEILIRLKHFLQENKTLCDKEINNTNNFSDYEIARNCTRPLNKTTVLFRAQQNLDVNKPINLRHDSDFDIEVYQRFPIYNEERLIQTYRVTGVDQTVKGMINEQITHYPPKLALKFHVSKQGILELKATSNYNITLWLSIQQGLSTGGIEVVYTPNKTEPMTDEQFNQTMIDFNVTNFTDSFVWQMRKEIGRMRNQEINSDLTIVVNHTNPQPLTADQIKESRKLLDELDTLDEQRHKTMERRNFLETYLYERREWLSSKEAQEYTTEEERRNASLLLEETKSWFEEEGYTANLTSIERHITKIQAYNAPINTRIDRYRRLTRSIINFERELNRTLTQGEGIRVKKPWTEDYYNSNFSVVANEVTLWFRQYKEKQSKLSPVDTPVLTTEMLDQKSRLLKSQLQALDRIQKPVIENNKINMEELINKQSIEDLIKSANETESNSTSTGNSTNSENQETGKREDL